MLVLEDVHTHYGKIEALHGVSVEGDRKLLAPEPDAHQERSSQDKTSPTLGPAATTCGPQTDNKPN